MVVFPDQGKSCVIVNTRLFAGIPALGIYGLLLLALSIVGVGFIALRQHSLAGILYEQCKVEAAGLAPRSGPQFAASGTCIAPTAC
jgi:hypothetical protein